MRVVEACHADGSDLAALHVRGRYGTLLPIGRRTVGRAWCKVCFVDRACGLRAPGL
jgi:hypothetical protein